MRQTKPLKGTPKKNATLFYMTPLFWYLHYAFPAAVFFIGLGMTLGIAQQTLLHPNKVLARITDNIRGWGWTPAIGWISFNDQNPSACGRTSPPTPACGEYGLNAALTATVQPDGKTGHTLNGFAWSDSAGFICFGNSCNIASCRTNVPTPPGQFYAYIDSIIDSSPKKIHGWGVICNEKDLGWISLSCEDTNSCVAPNTIFYQLAYDPATNKFHNVGVTGSPYGWNGNTDGSGMGYISFYPAASGGMTLVGTTENTNLLCSDNIDNDLNGKKDCADNGCLGKSVCPEICNNSIDDDGNGKADCADPVCSETSYCPENCTNHVDDDANTLIDCVDPDCTGNAVCLPEGNCTDRIDNDYDGQTDCADSDCISNPACVPEQHQCITSPNPSCTVEHDPAKRADCCCSDISDNNTGLVDCADPNCRNNAAVCSAWLRIEAGNIYSGGGIKGTTPSLATGKSNAAYCLRSDQTIQWTSDIACTEASAKPLELPSKSTNYRNKLGFLDLVGIRNGRYGPVVPITDGGEALLTNQLGGKVYHYTGSLPFTLTSHTFVNGIGPTGNGGGLLLIDGADLKITGNIKYSNLAVQDRIKNLASFGVIVVKNALGAGGNIIIDPTVSTVSGAYFAEDQISTGSAGHGDLYLKMYGLFIARRFNLQRDNNSDPNQAAEQIIFDGRAVVNPPPGMQDISKSLPRPANISF